MSEVVQKPLRQTPFRVEVITLVPTIWPQLLSQATGLVGRSFEAGIAQCEITDLRSFGKGAHRQVDDAPFGGGAGMVLCVEPLHRAIIEARGRTPDAPVVLLSPRGRRFCQEQAREFATGTGLTLICGRYEGVDERVYRYVDAQLSLGDFVLSAGDPAAWAVIDAVVRLLPGVLGNSDSILEESFGANLLEYPQYTRPALYDGAQVPDVLRSGDHRQIQRWRQEQAILLTERQRPDLLAQTMQVRPKSLGSEDLEIA